MTEPANTPAPNNRITIFIGEVRQTLARNFPEAVKWSDGFIRKCLETGLQRLNNYNPQNLMNLRLDNIPDIYRCCVLLGGEVECLERKMSQLSLKTALLRSMPS